MLEIRNSRGNTLQLPIDEKIVVEINSTLFGTGDVMTGNYSYPFSFGLTPQNKVFIDNRHLAESLSTGEIPVDVRVGHFNFKALMTFELKAGVVNCDLLIDLGELADTIRDEPLREFVTDTFDVGWVNGASTPSLLDLAQALPGVFPMVFPPFFNAQLVEEDFKPTPWVRPVIHNKFDTQVGIYLNVEEGEATNILVPMIYLGWLLRHICEKLGFRAKGNFFTDPTLSRLIIFNTQSTPGLSTSGYYHVVIARHLPDVTISELFKRIKTHLGMGITVDATTKTISFDVYRLFKSKSDYLDISKFLVPGSEGVKLSPDDGYRMQNSYFTEEKGFYDLDLEALKVGKGKNELDSQIGTLRMITQPIATGGNWLLPSSNEEGNLADSYFEDSDNYCPYYDPVYVDKVPELVNNFDFTLLIYWGLKPNSVGNNFPYASSVSYDSKYQVFGPLSLMPGEPDDLFVRYQRPYLEMMTYSKDVEALFRLPISVLQQINPASPLGLKMDNLAMNKMLLKKATYELPGSEGMVLVKAEMKQMVPRLIKGNAPEDPIIYGKWVTIVAENIVVHPDPEGVRQTADFVLYVWGDGLYTIQEGNVDFVVNYRIITAQYADGTFKVKYEGRSVVPTQHRTVLVSQADYVVGSAEWEGLLGIVKLVAFRPYPGVGYRIRR